jgi:hypothetical protein
MSFAPPPNRNVLLGATVAAALLLLTGCAGFVPTPGQHEAELLRGLGPATGRYELPEGGMRLEFATGPYGRSTWMADIDRSGRVVRARQVLNEAEFAAFQQRAPGLTRDELLRNLGRPGNKRQLGWLGGEVWSWRYPTNDCLWFQVTIGPDDRVRDSGYGPDPLCEKPPGWR